MQLGEIKFLDPPLDKMATRSGAKALWWPTSLLRLLIASFSVAQASEFAVPGEQEPLNVAATASPSAVQWDPKGYVVFCLCMGECMGGGGALVGVNVQQELLYECTPLA